MKQFALATTVLATACAANAADKVTFDQHIKPIFRQHCLACHSADDASGGLALDEYSAVMAGGAGGEVFAAGDADGSRLWKLITHKEQPVMPPGGDKMPDDQLKVIRQWIEGGLLQNAKSKPKASAKPAIAQVAADPTGKPIGPPAMPEGLFRQPIVSSPQPGPVGTLAASRWAPVAVTPWQRQVSFYHTQTHQLLGVVPYVEGVPSVVRFSRDGSLLLVAGGRHGALGNAALYDVKTGARLVVIGDELDIVLAADISPDKTLVAIGGPKKKVRVYRVADGQKAYEVGKHTDWITALAFSPDGKLLATGDRSTGLRTWDAAAGHERNDLRGHSAAITSIAWRSDGSVMASTSEDGSLRLWNQAGKQIKSSGAHGGGALCVAFAEDGRLVTAGRDRKVKLWKPDGNHLADLATMNDIALAACFTHDGASVVASDFSGEVRVVVVKSKKKRAALAPNPPMLEQRLSGAGELFVKAEQHQKQAADSHQTAVAAMNQGNAKHAAFNQQIAAAKKGVQQMQGQLKNHQAAMNQAEASYAGAQQAVEQATKAQSDAESQLAEFKKQLEKKATEVSKNDDESAEQSELAALEKTAAEAKATAVAAAQTMQKAQAERDQMGKQLESSRQALAKSEEQRKSVEGLRAALPKLPELKKAMGQTKQAAQAAEQQLANAKKQRDALAAELDRFRQAAAALAERSQSQIAAQTTIAQQRGGAVAERDAAAAKSAEQLRQIEQARKKMEQLQKQLADLEKQQRALAAQLDERTAKLDEVERAFAQKQRAAQVAEALLRDFTAAQALREAYGQE